jgi:hypothetical protein
MEIIYRFRSNRERRSQKEQVTGRSEVCVLRECQKGLGIRTISLVHDSRDQVEEN